MNKRIKILQEEKETLWHQLREIDKEIYQIRNECKHDGAATFTKPYILDNHRDIEERHVECNECGETWYEQKHIHDDDSQWPYELGERG